MKRVGFSRTPLLKKLGIKNGFKIFPVQVPKNYFKLLGKLPEGVEIATSLKSPLNFIHFFTQSRAEYEKKISGLKKVLVPNGMLWISWPKTGSKVPTDMSDNVVGNFALKNGLVDIKVRAVDETWSGLKLVIPVKDRKGKNDLS